MKLSKITCMMILGAVIGVNSLADTTSVSSGSVSASSDASSDVSHLVIRKLQDKSHYQSLKSDLQKARADYGTKSKLFSELQTKYEKYKGIVQKELDGISATGLIDETESDIANTLKDLKKNLEDLSEFEDINKGEKDKVAKLKGILEKINASVFSDNDLPVLANHYANKDIDESGAAAINHSLQQTREAAKEKVEKLTDEAIQKIQDASQDYKKTYKDYEQQKQEIEELQKTIDGFLEELEKIDKRLKEQGVFANAKTKQEQQVYEAMHNIGGKSDIPDQDIVEVADSLQEISNTSHKNTSTKISKLNSQLSTKTRLAKLSNPYNNNLAIAYAINNLKDEAFADSGDTLSSVFKEYTNRFNYDNNLWANVLGAKANLSSGQNAKMHGFSIGYDKAFDDTIVGGFTTISKSKQTSNTLENRANNYEFGVYARQFLNSHEIDVKTSFGVSKNKLNRNVILTNSALRTNGRFTSKFVSFELDYGYLFELGQSAFAKPNLGLSYLWLRNSQLKESGDLPVVVKSNNYKELSLNLGVEIRKYVADGSYFYLNPGFSQEIYKSQDDTVINFIGSSNKIIFDKDNDKKGYFTLQTGAEFSITTSLSTNINFGFKARDEEKYYTGTIGVRYKF
ncbi:autotransporter domain-containing protein [Campylobacter majalis]|uniref:autotransporter outer membrane beta-barrel domain-containing protein n=1 Tax=Campylobacter majalis TaxID=2790656 RepID=UPI003D698A07